jgi:hypothetical protein
MIDPYRALGVAAKATTAVVLGYVVGAVSVIAWASRKMTKGW